MHDVNNREKTHIEFQAQREKREMTECTFTPQVDVEREEEEYDDIFERLYETDIGATDYLVICIMSVISFSLFGNLLKAHSQ